MATASSSTTNKTPALVSIAAVLLFLLALLLGIVSLVSFAVNPIAGIGNILVAVGLGACAYGLSNMRRWGLLLFSFLIILSLMVSVWTKFSRAESLTQNELISALIFLSLTAYLWSITRKFR